MTGRWRLPLRFVALGYVALLIVVPVGAVFYRAFEHGVFAAWDAVTTPDGLHALWLTLLVVGIAVPLNTIFGVGTSLILARHRFPGAWLLDALVELPLAISPVVIGLPSLLVYGHDGWFGNWLAAHDRGHLLRARHHHGLRLRLPPLRRARGPAGAGGDRDRAGAGRRDARRRPLTVFRRITLPSIRWGLAYGVMLTTARVLGEFGAVAIVVGEHRRQDPDPDPVHRGQLRATSTRGRLHRGASSWR